MAPTGTTVARLNGLLLRFSVLLWLRTTLSQYQTSFPVEGWLQRYPDSLVSFYLGTGRPPQYQMQIAERLIVADKTRADFITLPRLIHGVCYSVPRQKIERVLTRWDTRKPADYAVGDAYAGNVIYPCWSLVDHADGDPVERHPDGYQRTERRRAWRINFKEC